MHTYAHTHTCIFRMWRKNSESQGSLPHELVEPSHAETLIFSLWCLENCS